VRESAVPASVITVVHFPLRETGRAIIAPALKSPEVIYHMLTSGSVFRDCPNFVLEKSAA
jgi:hypothetical protein